MNQPTNRVERFYHLQSVLRCPLCHNSMTLTNNKSMVCPNRHTFDLTRHGYMNFLTRSPKRMYDKNLFEARQRIIMDHPVYAAMHEAITSGLEAYVHRTDGPVWLADLGCGEGSHLHKVLEGRGNLNLCGVGLDISKEGILLAAKRYKEPFWLVGDLAKSPLADRSFHAILNILSPANYREFKRILRPDGLVIKVVPGPLYLQELRTALFHEGKKKLYRNDEIVALFQEHFRLLDHFHVRKSILLKGTGLSDLAQMTPLAWSANKERLQAFLNRESQEITVDLDIFIGKQEG